MANITGTAGADTLQGTNDRDEIFGLGGDDIIFGGLGRDKIDGGTGNDTLDYSNYEGGIGGITGLFLGVSKTGTVTISKGRSGIGDDVAPIGSIDDTIVNIETIIGNPKKINSIFISDFSDETPKGGKLDIDFSKNTFGYSFPSVGKKTITLKNFSSENITTGRTNDRVKGDDRDNDILTGSGDDTIIGSKGNDKLSEAETIDYSKLDNAVTVSALWKITRSSKNGNTFLSSIQNIEKGGVGTDLVRNAKKIIGTNNKENTLDVSSSNQDAKDLSIDINLAKNFIKVSGLPPTTLSDAVTQLEIVNFVNVIGSTNNDTIVGANKKGKLTGGGGNDTITGGNKNDIITGSDSTARGVGEVDTLTGGGGRDKFVLGDANGAYYVGKGKDDYATITDFNLFQDSIDLGGFKDYSFASGGNNSIELYSGKDIKTRDLIAKIQLAGGISNRSTNSRAVMGADGSLDAITSKIDILSGSSSSND